MTKRWNLWLPQHEGNFARQAHVDIPPQTFEREMGRHGFAGAATHFYHRNPHTAWQSISGTICPAAFDLPQVESASSPWNAASVLASHSCKIRFWRSSEAMGHLVRNADGDDLLFVHRGAGDFFCDYGHLQLRAGDYVLVPRGTMWRVDITEAMEVLMIEATGEQIYVPERGLMGNHAPFDMGVLARPRLNEAFQAQPRGGNWEVHVKRRDQIGKICYPFNPLDAVGWKGDLFPVRLNVDDFRPVSNHRVALPPSIHTTFESPRFMVGTIVPRPFETEPGALKLPWFHNNDDCDEVIFSHRGNLASRGGVIKEGTLTLHPSGMTHGPHPDVMPRMYDAQGMFSGYMVMIDTLDQLDVCPLPADCTIGEYPQSWRRAIELAADATDKKLT